MTQLPEVTIICVDCYNYGLATAALQKCNQQVKAARTVLLTDIVLKIDEIGRASCRERVSSPV